MTLTVAGARFDPARVREIARDASVPLPPLPALAPLTLPSYAFGGTMTRRARSRSPQPFEASATRWLAAIAPGLAALAPHQDWFWEHVWSIRPGERPRPLVALWPRGGGKSSTAELATVALAARGVRRYVLYVSGTQEQSEKHLDAIAATLDTAAIARHYPDLANRAVNKYGSSRGWRRNRLTTASGVVIDAVGLRTGTRGVKFEDQRPDLLILDDVDEPDDTPEVTAGKIDILTRTLLPAGAPDLAVIAIQNLITHSGLFARLAPGSEQPASWLADRRVSGPVPAVEGFAYEERDDPETGARRWIITGGRATWPAGQPIETCQQMVNDWGIDAFLAEAQHQPRARGEKLYQRAWWDGRNRYDPADAALLNRAVGRFMSWDTAESESATSAWTACVVGDLVPSRGGYAVLIREVWRDRVELPALMDAIERVGQRWGFDTPRPVMHYGCIVEYASSGKAVVQAARASAASLRVTAPPWLSRVIRPFTPRVPKDARALTAARFCRAGRVLLPRAGPDVPWLVTFEEELFSVPQARYRDLTDAFAQLVISLQNRLGEPGQPARVVGGEDTP